MKRAIECFLTLLHPPQCPSLIASLTSESERLPQVRIKATIPGPRSRIFIWTHKMSWWVFGARSRSLPHCGPRPSSEPLPVESFLFSQFFLRLILFFASTSVFLRFRWVQKVSVVGVNVRESFIKGVL